MIRLAASLLAACLVSGCGTTATGKLERRLKVGEPVSRVYFAKYEEVEAALKLSMIKYPPRVDNTEAGVFETDYVRGDARFRPPHSNEAYSSGYRYRLIVRMVRGRADEKPSVKVQILKQIEIVRDFFASPDPMPSDGLEENVILYRVGRELNVNRAIQRSTEKENKKLISE
jgi:hypothetical protein